jgi:NAD(P)-dependent dehydrogenase (short-subunit alcohol dehydrogenase family)
LRAASASREAAASVAVVLGGTSGIGAAIARRLAEPGVALVLNYLERHERAERLATELRDGCRSVDLVPGNIAESGTRSALTAAVDALGGRCDRLVHSVAVTSFKPLADVKPSQWSLIHDVSARSFLDSVVALRDSLAKAGGRVVAISSAGSVRHVPSYGALGSAKAALEASVRQLAVELAPSGIRVNALRAGLVESDAARKLPEEARHAVEQRTPARRLGTPEEIASVAAFLLGPDASWIVGEVIDVDGGFSLT